MSYRIDCNGIVYDHPSGVRIGVVDRDRGGILPDEEAYGDDGPHADAALDILAGIADINTTIGLLVRQFSADDTEELALRLRELGEDLGRLSTECLIRADDGFVTSTWSSPAPAISR
ncbi:MAG: hypothetical protein ACRDQA_20725 [Nocardioidaceae bacterium]